MLFTWPMAAALPSVLYDWHDPLLNAWIMAWEAHQLLLDPRHLFDANIFYPYPATLAFSESLFGISALSLPLLWAGVAPLTTHNVMMLVAFFMAGVGAYLLALHLTANRTAAVVAALIYAFAPYRFGQLSQLQLLTTGWLPLTLLYLDRLLWPRAAGRGATRRDYLLFAFFFVMQALSSFYYALFTLTGGVLYAVAALLLNRRQSKRLRATLPALALTLALTFVLLLPAVYPYFMVNRQLGASWSIEQNEQFSAPLQAFFHAPPSNKIWGTLTAPLRYKHGDCCPGIALWPGLTPLLLAAYALFTGRDARRWAFVGMAGVALFFALGPTLQIRPGEGSVTLPYHWLLSHVPGFSALRVPARWSLLALLALSVLAAWGVARRPTGGKIAVALLLIEFWTFPLGLVKAPSPSPAIDWLADQPPSVILELPLTVRLEAKTVPTTDGQARQISQLPIRNYFSIQHWHTTPDGYSGYIPPSVAALDGELCAFPTQRNVRLFQAMGIDYLVVHGDQYPPEQAGAIRQSLATLSGIEAVGCWAAGEAQDDPCPAEGTAIYRITAATDDSLPSVDWSLLAPETVAPGATVPLQLALTTPTHRYGPPTERITLDVRWTGPETLAQKVTVTPPLWVEQAALIPIEVVAPTVAGTYALSISGGPRPLTQQITVSEHVPASFIPVAATVADLQVSHLAPGETATVDLAWRYLHYLPRYFRATVQAVDSEGSIWAQPQAMPGPLPTIEWCVGESYGRRWELAIPADAKPPLHLNLLWHDEFSGEPARLWYEGEWRDTLRIEVAPPP
ncbi:MAG: hypothetical protein KDD73_03735 [Anaerolineales bacterium]|nr:hypothetical protein [Anaerolineales bacterium]